jgi:pimeloyl-ACP methyl ester carboxylesterase
MGQQRSRIATLTVRRKCRGSGRGSGGDGCRRRSGLWPGRARRVLGRVGFMPQRDGGIRAMTSRSNTQMIDGCALHRQGAGVGVVCLPAFADTVRSWHPLVSALSDRCEVVVVELPGLSRPGRLPGRPTVTDIANLTAGIVRRVWATPVTVVGHSLGSAVAVRAAQQLDGQRKSWLGCGVVAPARDRVGGVGQRVCGRVLGPRSWRCATAGAGRSGRVGIYLSRCRVRRG